MLIYVKLREWIIRKKWLCFRSRSSPHLASELEGTIIEIENQKAFYKTFVNSMII